VSVDGDETAYPWLRQAGETNVSYEAFRVYLMGGSARTTPKVAEAVGKSVTLIQNWSAQYLWVDRCRAYDNFLLEAETDGLVHQISESRDKNLALVDRLRWHLSNRLETFIERKEDPTVRWTQALGAMTKLEINCFAIKDDTRTQEQLTKVEGLIDRLMSERGPA
jgi:hypothetical protein